MKSLLNYAKNASTLEPNIEGLAQLILKERLSYIGPATGMVRKEVAEN
jgi:hypothetical protein